MSADPMDMVRQAAAAMQTHNELLAAKARLNALAHAGDRMALHLADLEDAESNAVTKAVLRQAIARWQEARSDA